MSQIKAIHDARKLSITEVRHGVYDKPPCASST